MAEHRTREGLDWAGAYARLERLTTRTEAGAATPEDSLAVLDARARALAQPLSPAQEAGTLLEVVRFRSGEQRYALETRFIHGVLRGAKLTALPGAPPVLRGLTLLRGEVLPLVELAPLFGRPATRAGDIVLVVGLARPELGLYVEEVEEVASLPRDTLLAPPAALGAESGGLVSGVQREGLLLLEAEALLKDSRLIFDLADEGSL
ncbi:chemotaxis protein CheW [Hyalangium sp.]|uniref:chemotaxis protein CheW n=1 Tax=Hyalangium sp. TaxID=2028555 RepID=UPI002D28FB5C|nr:chemotaxis protein CheW [Hyalangium sp.]HYI02498.1 chemotaxis protein CheW [Hyalangium sp.]